MNKKIKLTAIDTQIKPIIHAVQYDTARMLECYIADVDISDISAARIYARKPDGTEVYNDCTLEEEYILAPLSSQTLAVVGQVECQLQLKVGDTLTTFEFIIIVDESLVSSSAIESSNEYTALEDALNRVEDVEAGLPSKVSKSGDTMSGDLNMDGNTVTGLADPTDSTDAATKNYVDSHAPSVVVDDEMSETSENPVQNKVITETLQGLAADVETELNNKVSKTGDNITGILQFAGNNARITFTGTSANPCILAGGKRIAGVGTPQVITDAANVKYVDDKIAAALIVNTEEVIP